MQPTAPQDLTREERKSVTHGDFWIPEEEREKYKQAIAVLNQGGIPFVVTGAYAIYEYTGIYRETKDLDLFVQPDRLVDAMRMLRDAGFRTRLEQPHWIAKAIFGEHFIDMIFGMGNGLALVDADWYRHSRPAIFAAHPVRVAPAEELIWHRLFINERHRQDMADIVHLLVCRGDKLDWDRLLERTGEHWPLLLAQLQMFSYVYPEAKDRVPPDVIERLLERAREDVRRERSGDPITRGTLVSRFSFAIDVNEWGMRDVRSEAVRATERLPILQEIARSDVWDERSVAVEDFLQRTADLR
ncbi:MAG TPA: hypothetical protein VMN39_11020 [Longimicrobiaceae bacterium]|nr:hypothetical protein [Longimicrobiaceae bacterium]